MMKLGPGLYPHLLTADHFRFARQMTILGLSLLLADHKNRARP